MATEDSQLDILQVIPDPFDRVQVGCIPWQLLQVQPTSTTPCPHLHLRQEELDCLVPMDRCPIPDDQHLALNAKQYMFQEAHYIHSVESPLLHCHQQLSLLCDPTDHRQVIPRQWYVQDRCLPTRGIRMHNPSQQIEASLVYPDDDSPLLSRFFLMAGQRCLYQAAIAASSRWLAR